LSAFFSLKIVQKSTLAPSDFAQDPNKQAGSYRQRRNWECLPPRLKFTALHSERNFSISSLQPQNSSDSSTTEQQK